jgi:hypothetical protein
MAPTAPLIVVLDVLSCLSDRVSSIRTRLAPELSQRLPRWRRLIRWVRGSAHGDALQLNLVEYLFSRLSQEASLDYQADMANEGGFGTLGRKRLGSTAPDSTFSKDMVFRHEAISRHIAGQIKVLKQAHAERLGANIQRASLRLTAVGAILALVGILVSLASVPANVRDPMWEWIRSFVTSSAPVKTHDADPSQADNH